MCLIVNLLLNNSHRSISGSSQVSLVYRGHVGSRWFTQSPKSPQNIISIWAVEYLGCVYGRLPIANQIDILLPFTKDEFHPIYLLTSWLYLLDICIYIFLLFSILVNH